MSQVNLGTESGKALKDLEEAAFLAAEAIVRADFKGENSHCVEVTVNGEGQS